MTIGSFIPIDILNETNPNGYDINHPDWETKGKEVARFALLYTNNPTIEKPKLKKEKHGFYWKMTNYQGWNNDVDISNSPEISSMLFHYDRERIGLYRNGLYYYDLSNNENQSQSNWTKFQINDTPAFHNYDEWIYNQKQDAIHSSIILCNYENDLFYEKIEQIHCVGIRVFVLSKMYDGSKKISVWNIETNKLVNGTNSIRSVTSRSVSMLVSSYVTNNLRNIFVIRNRSGTSKSKLYLYTYDEVANTFSYNGSYNLPENNTNNVNPSAFLLEEFNNYINVIYENDSYKNNSIGYNVENLQTGSAVYNLNNNNNKIFKSFSGQIGGTNKTIYISYDDIVMWQWNGTNLYNKVNLLNITPTYQPLTLTNFTFCDMFLYDNNTILTTVKSSGNNYKLIKWHIMNDTADIMNTAVGINDSVFDFTSDTSNVMITKNKYYSYGTTNPETIEYLFLNVTNNASRDLIGIPHNSTDWTVGNITLYNKYDFDIEHISSGTNKTIDNVTDTETHDYSMLYTTLKNDNQENKNIFKIKLSNYYDIIDVSTLLPPIDRLADIRIETTTKIKPYNKGFTSETFNQSGLFIAFANRAEMPSPTWIYTNFGLDWRKAGDWDNLLDFYHSFDEPDIYIDNSPGSEYGITNILDLQYYNNKTYTGNDSVFNLKASEINNDASFAIIGHPKIHWSGDYGENGIGAFPVLQYNGREPENLYELGHRDKIINKLNVENRIETVWDNIDISNDITDWFQKGYNKRGVSQYKKIINSEPWKIERTLWWEVQVPEDIETTLGIPYADAIQDYKYYIQFAKDYPAYGFTKGEFVHWGNESENYKFLNTTRTEKSVDFFYLQLKPDKFGGYPINRTISSGGDFLNLTQTRNVNSRKYNYDSRDSIKVHPYYEVEKTLDANGTPTSSNKVYLVTQYISAYFYPKNDVSNTELSLDNINNHMDVYYFTNINLPPGTIKECEQIIGTFDYLPNVKHDNSNNPIYLDKPINISGWKKYDNTVSQNMFDFSNVLYSENNIAFNNNLSDIFITGLTNNIYTDIKDEGLKDDFTFYNQITDLSLTGFENTSHSGINGNYKFQLKNNENLDVSFNGRRIFNKYDAGNNQIQDYEIKYDLSYGWSIYDLGGTGQILYNDISYNRRTQTVNLQPGDNLKFKDATDYSLNPPIIGNMIKSAIQSRDIKIYQDNYRTKWEHLNSIADISYSNDKWRVDKIDKGIVFITYSNPNNINDIIVNPTIKPQYVIAVSNVYQKIETIPNSTNIDICNVYWIDEIVSWNDGYGHNSKFDNERNAQIPLVDLSVNNTIYTIENKLVGMGGFKEIADISGDLLYTYNFKDVQDGTLARDNQDASFVNTDLKTYGYYKLADRYDIRSINNTHAVKQNGYLNSLHDKLYYDHDWTRIQTENLWDNSANAYKNRQIANGIFTVNDLSFETVFVDLSFAREPDNILFTDLSNTTFANCSLPFKREQVSYEFPYLYLEYQTTNDQIIQEIMSKYDNNEWSNFNFRDASNSDGIIIDPSILSTPIDNDISANLFGTQFFKIDLLQCCVRIGETTYNDISDNKGYYRYITELGQDISENNYMIYAYLYGKHNENGKKYLVFKYKEPANYALNPIEDSNQYRQYGTQSPYLQEENIPKGGDKYRNLIGLNIDYKTTGLITLNADISEMIYLPLKVKFNYKYNTYTSKENTQSKKIMNTFSNGTSVYILKLNVLENRNILNTSSVNKNYDVTRTIVEENADLINIPSEKNIRLSRTYHKFELGSKVKPVKYLINYNENETGVADTLSTAMTNTEISNFRYDYIGNNIITYFPLNGSQNGSWLMCNITDISINEQTYLQYVKETNVHDNTKLKSYLHLLRLKPVSCQYGSKIHNYIYEPFEDVNGLEQNIRSPARTTIKILYPLDESDGVSNIAQDASGNIIFNIDNYGLLRIKYTPKSFGIGTFYSIPYTITNLISNKEFEASIHINLVAKYLIETDNVVLNLSDNLSSIIFNLPYKINTSAIEYTETSTNDNIYNNMEFVVYGNNTIGDIIIDPSNNKKNEAVFMPNSIYIDRGGPDTNGWDSNTYSINNTNIYYKIKYNGEEFVNRNNNIFININNGYNEPKIEDTIFSLDVSNSDFNENNKPHIYVRFTDIISRDEAIPEIEFFDFDGSYYGEFEILEYNGYYSIKYTPNDNYIGNDYIFFSIRSKNIRDPDNDNQLTGIQGRENRGYIKIIVFSSYDSSDTDVETGVDISSEEIATTRTYYTVRQSSSVDSRMTQSEIASNLARNIKHYQKKIQIHPRDVADRKAQNSRKILKILNF